MTGANSYSRSKHRFHIPCQPFDLFMSPDLDSSFSASQPCLNPEPATHRSQLQFKLPGNGKIRLRLVIFSHQLLCWLKPFIPRTHCGEQPLKSLTAQQAATYWYSSQQVQTHKSEMNIKLYFTALTLSSHQTVSLYPFLTFSPSLQLSLIILTRQFCPLHSFSLSVPRSPFCRRSPTLFLLPVS